MEEEVKNEVVEQQQEAAAPEAATPDQPPAPQQIRMPSTAIGEVNAFLNNKMLECIGEVEYYHRAALAGYPVPAAQTDYLQVKLRDYGMIRDAITNVFFYKRLDKEEADAIQKAYQEQLEKAKAEAAVKAAAETAAKKEEATA